MSASYTLHGIRLPRPVSKNKFDLRVGRRHVSDDQKGARRLQDLCRLWDWFATRLNHDKLSTIDDYVLHVWDPKLKDISAGKYPSYILDYEKELRKVRSWCYKNGQKCFRLREHGAHWVRKGDDQNSLRT